MQEGVLERERLLVFTARWKNKRLRQVELRAATRMCLSMCTESRGREDKPGETKGCTVLYMYCMFLCFSIEEREEEREAVNSLWQSISAATNGWSAKLN